MASESVIREGLNDLGARLEDARTVLDMLTDIEPGESVEAKKLHRGSLTAFRMVADALEALKAVEAAA